MAHLLISMGDHCQVRGFPMFSKVLRGFQMFYAVLIGSEVVGARALEGGVAK